MNKFIQRLLIALRRRLWDYPLGMGRPVPSASFDAEYRSGHWDLLNMEEELARSMLLVGFIAQTKSRARILDLGCGPGILASLLSPYNPASYVGLDISTEAINSAVGRSLQFAEFFQGDYDTWLPTAKFDFIIFNESIGYSPDPLRTISRYIPYLTGDGTILISLFNSGNSRFIWKRITRSYPIALSFSVSSAPGRTWNVAKLLKCT